MRELSVPDPVNVQTWPATAGFRNHENEFGSAYILPLLAAHAVLGVVMHHVGIIANLHALAVLIGGLLLAAFSPRVDWIIWGVGYVVGAEVLWRMSGTSMPYEMGKYLISVMVWIGLIRKRTYKLPPEAILYFLMLLPSLLISYMVLPGLAFRKLVSFNISGPFALMSVACFFANVTLEKRELQKVLITLLIPISGIASAAVFGIVTNPDIVFGTESVHDASGGFGPNQVSAVLGLGSLIAFHFLMQPSSDKIIRLVMVFLILWFLVQATLTFSRGGIFAALLAAGPAIFYFARVRGQKIRVLSFVLIGVLICAFGIYPWLDSFTGGALTQRYQKTDMSGREGLMAADIEIWQTNPIFGVGLGLSTLQHRRYYGRVAAPHNEFSRLLAEHGFLGFIACVLLFWMALRNLLRPGSLVEKAFISSMAVWALLFFGSNGMRVVAGSFVFGITFMRLRDSSLRWASGGRSFVPWRQA